MLAVQVPEEFTAVALEIGGIAPLGTIFKGR